MVILPGYHILEKLYESSRSLIYRAQRSLDQVPVILKVLRQEYPSPAEIARFQMEYDILSNLKIEGVIKTYGLESYPQNLAIVLEDFGAESLQSWLSHHTINLEDFLVLAIQIVTILDEVHRHHIIHKDLNPSNIVLNPITQKVKIIDFGIATILSQETPTFRSSNLLEGTLAYMSPEQTGRMNRAMDYRTDFYSLGATLYYLLCDRLPFETDKALELIHCHIARQPISPYDLIGANKTVSNIVMKLLAKNAEERYQSAWGIKADLEECLNQLRTTSAIAYFPPGRHDVSEQFYLPQKLYGREAEISTLLATFERVATSGTSEMLLLSGYPGIGKTSLVQELYQQMTHHRGYFITGKYDQLQRNVPYSGLIQAFQTLIQQLLTESESQIQAWQQRLLAALGDNGQVMIDVIPEVEFIIGQQPSSSLELPPTESQHRFLWVFERFIHAFTQDFHPLVIFLDDLQWVDCASVHLIQQWITASNCRYLLLIGAYRDNEVTAVHPLLQQLDDIRLRGTVHQIALSPLKKADVDAMLQDILQCEPEQSLPLADLILQKTEGNPFFIREFLRVLNETHLIDFNPESRQWQWNLSRIQSTQLPDTIAELVANRIQTLPAQTQQILSIAACIGSQFDLYTLAVISERSPLKLVADLQFAIQHSMIAPIGEDYKYLILHLNQTPQLMNDWCSLASSITYQFLHDRIQQVAYSFIPDKDKPWLHLKIGQLWLTFIRPDLLEDSIFQIIEHLNMGLELITEPDQKIEFAQLNFIAGQKAKAAIAYEPALNYLNIGRTLLPGDSWQTAYELTLKLCEANAEAAYLAGNFEEMEEHITEVLHHTNTILEQTNVYLVKVRAYIAQNRLMEAIQTALQVLKQLGIQLPEQPCQQDIHQGLAETKRILTKIPIENLGSLPPMTDPCKLAAMQMIASVCTPTYFLIPELWELMVFQKIQLSVNYGNAPGSAFGYADYGMIQCGVENNITAAYQFAQLATTLQLQLHAKEFIPKTSLLVNMYLKHWREHLKETLNPLLEAYECGLETGDLEYATFAIAFRFYHSYLVGQELAQLEQEISNYIDEIARFKQVLPLKLAGLYRQVVLNLIQPSASPSHLVVTSYNENEQSPILLTTNDLYIQFHLALNKLILCYLFQDFTQAAKYAITTDHLLSEGAVGLLVVPVFYFYDSLAKLAVFSAALPEQQVRILETVDANQMRMKHWADHAPMNYLHKFYLVEAERYRVLGRDVEAADAYDRAIDLAHIHEYLNEEALANELTGRFYLAKGKLKIAKAYLLDARYCYVRWGAMAKVHDLDQQYPQFFDRLSEQSTLIITHSLSTSPTASSSASTERLDLATLMKVSQALSGEIVLNKLLEKLMMILIESAGAEHGCLILETAGRWQIEAEGRVDPLTTSVLQGIPMDSEVASDRLSLAVVHYVARTQESVVLNQVIQDYRFSQDPYIVAKQPKSILCAPLIYQGKRSGILYLENNLTIDAFTRDRVEVLQFLSTQAAISIDNAQLYNQLELHVQERTTELTQTNQRLQTEIIERQRSEQTLRLIVEGTASVTGEDFFRSLVRSLAQALQVRYALVSECVDHAATRVRTFAFWQNNQLGENLEYDLVDTPCERVINGRSCQFYRANLQSQFPHDEILATWQAESYLGVALRDSAGKVLGHLAVLDDKPMEDEPRNQTILEIFAARAAVEIERKQAEEALQISEAKFSTAFRSSPDAITISTLQDGCYIEVNDSCLRMLGYSREEMIGQTALDLGIWARPEERDAIKQALQAHGAISNQEIQFRKKTGDVFPALFSAEIIDLEGEPCLLSVAADITMLKQAEKALERLAEVGELAAMIVHEVRNPLTTIKMGLNSFKKLQLSERFQEYLALALDEADRLQRLLNQILLYSRPQTLRRSPLELQPFVRDTLSTLQTIPTASGKHFTFVAPDCVIKVLADPDKLKQVLINLVTNAYEAISENETITVSLEKPTNNQVWIQVCNGGEPISAEVLPKLTKPFFTTKVNGTGLGLAIVKRIVEAHDGEFSIESSTVTGTIAKVKLPAISGS